ncbi:FAD-binding domain-containing protein [Lojkania enalia]|uniref:Delta(24)-sterol reductase n=1 Tax=Lojkania enalia TaxID=147567 RepID=A0A9P4K1F2_9PLEO|nr:FAD-binding domain-containing protein [Didymosphaeria enalia]
MAPYTLADHSATVKALSVEVSAFHTSKTPFRINHGSTNSTRVRAAGTPTLNIGHLNHILSISPESETAIVEPNVPLDALVAATLPQGFIPLVVMEFPGITVGGGFSGASGESSSWREGLFDCTITEIEVILGNGEIVKAVKGGLNNDLFDMARCSLGTLGVVTLLTIKLRDARPYVEVTYQHANSIPDVLKQISKICEDNYTKSKEAGQGSAAIDFVEAIQYSPDHGAVITGRLVSCPISPSSRIQRFDRGFDPWFYQHAKSVTLSKSHTELVPTSSYFFRYDRGAFWSGESFFKYLSPLVPNNAFTRWLCAPTLTTRAIYKSMHASGGPEANIVQDLILPFTTAQHFLDYVAEELQIWPIWICPVRHKAEDVWGHPVWHPPNATTHSTDAIDATEPWKRKKGNGKDDLTLNFGVWGAGPSNPDEFRRVNRRMEDKLRELHGMKVLYAHSFYSEDEFWGLYDKTQYERARKKWHADALPSVWQKIKRNEVKKGDPTFAQRMLQEEHVEKGGVEG